MTETITLATPREKIEFDGERCTPWVTSQILAAHLHRYFSVLDLVRGRRVLDISCGEGYGAALMRRSGAADVTGADVDIEIVARANRVYGRDGIAFEVADARNVLPFDTASFDVVVSFETIEHIAEHDTFLAELKRVLTPAGTLVISTPDAALSDPEAPNPFHAKELTEGEFLHLIRQHFTHVAAHHQGYLHGSFIKCSGTSKTWKRTGFLDYAEDATSGQRYVLAGATNGTPATLPSGMLHDGAIVATLNRRIAALEARVKELEAPGAITPEGADKP